ncbi:MAG: DUF2059 domain-containing protein [Chthoniobacterales bacterium]
MKSGFATTKMIRACRFWLPCVMLFLQVPVITAQDTPPQAVAPLPEAPISPEKAALAEQLLGLFQMDKAFDENFEQISHIQQSTIARSKLTPQEMAKQIKILQVTLLETKKIFNWELLKGDFIKIYARLFSEEELTGIVDFFQSSVGKSFIEKQPQLQAALVQKMQEVAAQIEPKINAAMEKARAEAMATPTPTPTPTPSSSKGKSNKTKTRE